MSVFRRIVSALAANAFGQAVTVGSQLLLTPLYFKFWGAAQYGEWLILSSIPAYLTMADMGIGSAAGNDMTLRAGAGDRQGAQQTFLGAMWVSAGAAGLALLVGLAAAGVAGFWQLPHTPGIAPREAGLVLMGLALTVALGFTGGVVSAGFRACGRNAQGIVLANVARLIEVLATGGLLVAGRGPAWVCLGMVLVKGAMLLLQWRVLRQTGPWLFAPGVRADRHIVRRLVAPALGFLAFPLGNALALQGPILIIGAVLGGPAVAMFSSLRTLARIPMQVTNMFNASVWPEMSLAYGSKNLALLRRLHRASWGLTFVLIAALSSSLALAGSWVVHHWLGPNAPFDQGVFLAIVLATALCAVWGASSVVLVAINQHLRMGMVYLVVNGFCMALAAWAGATFGWVGLLVPLVLADALLVLWVTPQALQVSADTASLFLRAAITESWGRMRMKPGAAP